MTHPNVIEFEGMIADTKMVDEDVRKGTAELLMEEMVAAGTPSVDVHETMWPIDSGKYSTPWLRKVAPGTSTPILDELKKLEGCTDLSLWMAYAKSNPDPAVLNAIASSKHAMAGTAGLVLQDIANLAAAAAVPVASAAGVAPVAPKTWYSKVTRVAKETSTKWGTEVVRVAKESWKVLAGVIIVCAAIAIVARYIDQIWLLFADPRIWVVIVVASLVILVIASLRSSMFDRASARRWFSATSLVLSLLVVGGAYWWWNYGTDSEVATTQFAATTESSTSGSAPTPAAAIPAAATVDPTSVISFDYESLPQAVQLAITENSDSGAVACAIFKALSFKGEQANFDGKEWLVLRTLVASKGYQCSQEEITSVQNSLFEAYGMRVGPGGTIQNMPAAHEASFRECLVYAGRRTR